MLSFVAGQKLTAYIPWCLRSTPLFFGRSTASRHDSNEQTVGFRSIADDNTVLTDLRHAAATIHGTKALVFTSGAGMGVDSGLPDFRGPEGFWRAYPALRGRGIQLMSMSTPHWFEDDPTFAWGFFGHRYNLYKHAQPHDGFRIILNWCRKMEHGYFAFTSNVDGHLQCVNTSISSEIWPVPSEATFDVGDDLRLRNAMPTGPPGQNHPARPNILMFGDWSFQGDRTDQQEERFRTFQRNSLQKGVPFVVIEIGAGLAVPTVRQESETLVSRSAGSGTLIRINPCEPQVPRGHIGLQMTGLKALQQLQEIYETL